MRVGTARSFTDFGGGGNCFNGKGLICWVELRETCGRRGIPVGCLLHVGARQNR